MVSYECKDWKDTRSGFGEALFELGQQDSRIVALCADLTGSLKMDKFAKSFPERFFQAGIAEANMIGVAAGLTIGGRIPFAGSFANFVTGRVFDQIRQSVAYSNTNVKICASHAGLTLGEDGATHQILEDIGLMRMLPNMWVVNPADFNQTKAATHAIAKHQGPVYLRFGRPVVPNFSDPGLPFELGKAIRLFQGTDLTLIATGHLVWKAIQAHRILKEMGISAELLNMHTIKPLDVDALESSILKTGAIVTCEEHQRNGGLGDAVAQWLATHQPRPMEMVAVNDSFGQSGTPEELLVKYHLDTPDIVEAALRVLARK